MTTLTAPLYRLLVSMRTLTTLMELCHKIWMENSCCFTWLRVIRVCEKENDRNSCFDGPLAERHELAEEKARFENPADS